MKHRLLFLNLLVLLVSVAVPVAPATPGSGKPPVLPIDTVNSGTVYFGGTKLDPPYAIGVELGSHPHFVINGMKLIDPSDGVDPVPANGDVAALVQASSLGRMIAREGMAAGKSDAEMLEAWRTQSLTISRIASVTVDVPRREITFISSIGLRQTDRLSQRNPKPHPSEQAIAVANARTFIESLKNGDVLFFTPNGGTLGTSGAHSSDFEQAVEKVKRGQALTKFETQLLPDECQRLIRKPAKPVRAL